MWDQYNSFSKTFSQNGNTYFKLWLTHFGPMFDFYIPLKTSDNLWSMSFSGGIGMEYWPKIV